MSARECGECAGLGEVFDCMPSACWRCRGDGVVRDELPRVPGDGEIRVRAEYESVWAEPEPPCADCGRVPNSGVDGCWCAESGGDDGR